MSIDACCSLLPPVFESVKRIQDSWAGKINPDPDDHMTMLNKLVYFLIPEAIHSCQEGRDGKVSRLLTMRKGFLTEGNNFFKAWEKELDLKSFCSIV